MQRMTQMRAADRNGFSHCRGLAKPLSLRPRGYTDLPVVEALATQKGGLVGEKKYGVTFPER